MMGHGLVPLVSDESRISKKPFARPFNTWRRSKLMTEHEMSAKDYDAILEQQGGGCAICEKKSRKKLFVDRCQSTSIVRGLLCPKCLTFLECFDFDANRMLAAAKYRDAPCVCEQVRVFRMDGLERSSTGCRAGKADRPFLVWRAHLEGSRGDEQ
jgi:hypothetical protein